MPPGPRRKRKRGKPDAAARPGRTELPSSARDAAFSAGWRALRPARRVASGAAGRPRWRKVDASKRPAMTDRPDSRPATPSAERALDVARRLAAGEGTERVAPRHLAAALWREESRGAEVLRRAGAEPVEIGASAVAPDEASAVPLSDDLERLRERAVGLAARDPEADGVGTDHLAAAWLEGDRDGARLLAEAGRTASSLLGLDEAVARPTADPVVGPPITLEADERIDWGNESGLWTGEASGGRQPSRDRSEPGTGNREQGFADSREAQLPPDAATVRVLDAATNRCREGLRVLEDYARFVRDDRHLAEGLKQLRHELADLMKPLAWERRAVCRDTEGDVGTEISTEAERVRASSVDLILANAGRASEAFRTLEEFGKTVGEYTGGHAQQLRYMLYTFEKALLTAERADKKLEGRNLYLLTDASPASLRATTRALASGSVGLVQLRDKTADDRTLLAAGRTLRKLTAAHGVLFIVNDRPDLAVATHADGVHVGQGDVPVKEARLVVGPDRLVGLSTHSPEQARAAVLAGADYIGVGACFPTETKEAAEVNGLELVRAVAAEVSLPFFAIGGIGPDNVADVRAAGGRRVAVSGAVLTAEDPARAVTQLAAGG